MKKDAMWKLCLAVVFSLALVMAGCGGGGGGGDVAAVNPDTDGDGIPDVVDALPTNPARFVSNVTVLLSGLGAGQGGFTAATAVGNNGSVVGFSEVTAAPTGIKAVRWTVDAVNGSAGAPVTLNPISAGGTYSAAYGVNGAGLTVGESESGTTFVAAFWGATATSGAAATALPASATFPATGRSAAYGMNNNATPQIVGEATNGAGALRAVIWNGTSGAPQDLGILTGGTFSAAYAISDTGLVVGEGDVSGGGATHALAWVVDAAGAKVRGPVDLGTITIADVRSVAFGVDSSGHVVGESEDQAGVVHAGMWTLDPTTLAATAKKDLGANGTAYAINDASRIAGNLGTTDLGTMWDLRNPALPDTAGAVPTTTFSQALGMNSGNLVVGLSGTATGARAFAAFPKQ